MRKNLESIRKLVALPRWPRGKSLKQAQGKAPRRIRRDTPQVEQLEHVSGSRPIGHRRSHQFSDGLLVILLFCCVALGCAHTVKIEKVNNSLAHIRKGLGIVLPGGVRAWSQNQRTLSSHYFPPDDPKTKNSSKLAAAESAPVRAIVTSVILGERRPYVVEFNVYIEVKDKQTQGYRQVRNDRRLAKMFAAELQEYLVKSQENRDLIDDFRPF